MHYNSAIHSRFSKASGGTEITASNAATYMVNDATINMQAVRSTAWATPSIFRQNGPWSYAPLRFHHMLAQVRLYVNIDLIDGDKSWNKETVRFRMEFNNIMTQATFTPTYDAQGVIAAISSTATTLGSATVNHYIMNPYWFDDNGVLDDNEATASVTINMLQMNITWRSGYIYCYAFIDTLKPGEHKVQGPESITVVFDPTKHTDQW